TAGDAGRDARCAEDAARSRGATAHSPGISADSGAVAYAIRARLAARRGEAHRPGAVDVARERNGAAPRDATRGRRAGDRAANRTASPLPRRRMAGEGRDVMGAASRARLADRPPRSRRYRRARARGRT